VDKTVVVKCGRPKSTGVRENATFCYGVLGQVLEECRTRILFLPFQITSDNKHTNCHVGSGINYQNVPVRSYWCKTVRIQFIYLTPWHKRCVQYASHRSFNSLVPSLLPSFFHRLAQLNL